MADHDLQEFYRNWLKANKPEENTEKQKSENNQQKDNINQTPSETENENQIEEVELQTESNNNVNDQESELQPQQVEYDTPEDIVFENDQIQLYIERGKCFSITFIRNYYEPLSKCIIFFIALLTSC